jgi:Zn-dependent peptidase ImmA (M78 family)/DNA-binding XRE family transcriptional regulator
MFNRHRLGLARKRRRLTGKGLAELAGVSPITVSRIENGENPDDGTVEKLAQALGYPVEFFSDEDPEAVDTGAVSFRALTKMTARERDAALAAAALGLQVSDWIEAKFSLPESQLPDLSYETAPSSAAHSLRQMWGLGDRPIANLLGLLETKGLRVFSLSEKTASIDAFSFWRNEKPFVFLNNFKTAEHSLMDGAHEVGHLCLHRHAGAHAGTASSRLAEREANEFASAFLMPENDVRPRMPLVITVPFILKAKLRWRVSAMALTYRLHALKLLSDWQYKSTCIELTRMGYRTGEPIGIERETSRVWQKVLAQLWAERKTKHHIASALHMPLEEVEALIWGVAGGPIERPARVDVRQALRAVN